MACKHGFMVEDCNVCARERRDAAIRREVLDEVERYVTRLGQQEGSVDLGTVRRALADLRGGGA